MKFAAISAFLFGHGFRDILLVGIGDVLQFTASLAAPRYRKSSADIGCNRRQECDQDSSEVTHEGFQFRAVFFPVASRSAPTQYGTIIAIEPCYCDAILIIIDMRDGIFSFYIRSDETVIRAIAIVENDSIRGFNRSHIYSIERLEYSLDRLRKDRNTNWRVKATAYTRQGVSMRGFPAKLEGEEGDEQFWFEGGSDANRRVRVEIQGAWLQNLPWDRAAYRQKAA